MSFDLPQRALSLDTSGTQPALGAAHTLTLPPDPQVPPQEAGDAADAPLVQRASALCGEPPAPLTLTY